MHDQLIVRWDFNSIAVSLGPVQIHWYGIFWCVAFLSAEFYVRRLFSSIGRRDVDVSGLIVSSLLGTIVGARLGHCFFYDPWFYFAQPLKILAIWEGGMASHGGAVGFIGALALTAPRHASGVPFLTLLDVAAIPAAFGAALIRIANFLNSEIIGSQTSGQWGVVFERVDAMPRHPVQLYEATTYLAILIVLRVLASRDAALIRRGYLTGTFLSLVFSARAVLEIWKSPQAAYEMGNSISVGQWLSVPFALLGAVLMIRARFAHAESKAL